MLNEGKPSLLLDSSVVVKWYISEKNSELSLLIQEKFLSQELNLFLPELALYELAKGLRYSGLYEDSQIQEYLHAIYDIEVEVIPFSFSCLQAAITLSMARGLAVYDAYFVVQADDLGMLLVTADEKAYQKIKDFEFVTTLTKYGEQLKDASF